jgi:hypothetical protein
MLLLFAGCTYLHPAGAKQVTFRQVDCIDEICEGIQSCVDSGMHTSGHPGQYQVWLDCEQLATLEINSCGDGASAYRNSCFGIAGPLAFDNQ